MWAKRGSADLKVAAEQASMERQSIRLEIKQLGSSLHERKGNLGFLERCNNAAEFRCSKVNDE